MTFSIVATDPVAPSGAEWGVAVASKFLAVGSVVAWARAGAGAIATQAFAKVSYGPDGLELMSAGRSATDTLAALTGADPGRAQRQAGAVDAAGLAATFTGDDCMEWAGGRTGHHYCCQGNILVGGQVVEAMARAFEEASGDLASRLLAALAAGDDAGGDRRGRQSASLLVARSGGGYLGDTDIALDLRVDDHPRPVPELSRLVELHRLYFPSPDSLEFDPIDAALAREIRDLLANTGYEPGSAGTYDASIKGALFAYVGAENLEERWSDDAAIERVVLRHLRDQASSQS